jgi:MFS family permease
MFLAAIEYVQRDLNATTNEIALSLSLFILVQGVSPLLWSSVSDIKGRKVIYISSMLVRVFFSQPASDAEEF